MNEIDISGDLAELDAAKQKDLEKATHETLQSQTAIDLKSGPAAVSRWVLNLPKNIGVGLMDASLAVAHGVDDLNAGMESAAKTKQTLDKQNMTDAPPAPPPVHTAPVIPPHVSGALYQFRDHMVQNDGTSDEITQAVAQYAIPFMGYAKLIGGLRGATLLGTAGRAVAAETLTAASVLESHAPRAADLLALGRTVEGKFGDALRTAAPDGSLINGYIDYMTSREDESAAAGRFKNVVDNLTLTAAVAGMFKVTATALKGGRLIAEGMPTAGSKGSFGPSAQQGHIVFHGSPNASLTDLKPGTAASARGHGVYLSESPGVAGEYKTKTGALYTVHVPDESVARMLRWDEPLRTQPAAKAAFAAQGIRGTDLTGGEAYRLLSEKLAPPVPANQPLTWTMTDISPFGDKEASQALSAAGVPGVVYPASGKYSSGGSGANNVVLFDGKHAKIVKKE